jgi:hypothetical protein
VEKENLVALVDQLLPTTRDSNIDDNEIHTPDQYKDVVTHLVNSNSDLFASKDNQLSRTNTVPMEIDTGDHSQINLKPYRTPLTKRGVIDKAVDDMLN